MAKVNFVVTAQQITVFLGNCMEQINRAHPNFELVKEKLKDEDTDVETIRELVKPVANTVISAMNSVAPDLVKIDVDGNVFIKGVKASDYFSDRVRFIVSEGYSSAPYLEFMKNLMKNPSEEARARLFEFLDKNGSPITEDGHFITFKRVRSDFKDIYTGTFDNSPGSRPKVDRSEVDPDSRNTCSRGLHVAASRYLDSYASAVGNKTIICKVNPEHVVAVPPDYMSRKMRVCEYEVLTEVDAPLMTETEEKVFVKSDTLESITPAKSEVTRVFKSTKPGEKIYFTTSDGTRKFDSEIISHLLKNSTVAALARTINVAESTLRGWIKRLPENAAREVLWFTRGGEQFSETEIMAGVEEMGQTAWGKSKGIPSGTISGWVKKIKEAQ